MIYRCVATVVAVATGTVGVGGYIALLTVEYTIALSAMAWGADTALAQLVHCIPQGSSLGPLLILLFSW
jgi:hypothetical protein